LKLRRFFAANPGIKPGDRLSIDEIERGKKYALNVVK